jgi:hypothetical protein
MKVCCLLITCLSLSFAAQEENHTQAKSDAPVYEVLFEKGFYSEAIEYLEVKLQAAHPDTNIQEYQKYLAFCYILTEQKHRAKILFRDILNRDYTFTLDPIRTSPKIYKVFHAAQNQWKGENKVRVDSLRQVADSAVKAALKQEGLQASGTETFSKSLFSPWYRAPLYVTPFGSGQFYNRQTKKGLALFLIQSLSLGSSIWAFNKRYRDFHDDETGWQTGHVKYSNIHRIQFGVFLLAYGYSVFDSFWHRVRLPGQEAVKEEPDPAEE